MSQRQNFKITDEDLPQLLFYVFSIGFIITEIILLGNGYNVEPDYINATGILILITGALHLFISAVINCTFYPERDKARMLDKLNIGIISAYFVGYIMSLFTWFDNEYNNWQNRSFNNE